jgi:hypothetical protein
LKLKNIYLIADTETTGLAPFNLVFDFAYVIADRKTILIERQFLTREILCNGRTMLTALYKEDWRAMMGAKLFNVYIPAIAAQEMKIYSWREIIDTMRDDILTHNVNRFCAYNLRFDMSAMSKTQKHIYQSGMILSRPCALLDLWLCCCEMVFNLKLYHETALRNDWITQADNVRTTAEHAYKFLTGDHDMLQDHTALADVHIELEILRRILAKKKKLPIDILDANPWRRAQRIRLR